MSTNLRVLIILSADELLNRAKSQRDFKFYANGLFDGTAGTRRPVAVDQSDDRSPILSRLVQPAIHVAERIFDKGTTFLEIDRDD